MISGRCQRRALSTESWTTHAAGTAGATSWPRALPCCCCRQPPPRRQPCDLTAARPSSSPTSRRRLQLRIRRLRPHRHPPSTHPTHRLRRSPTRPRLNEPVLLRRTRQPTRATFTSCAVTPLLTAAGPTPQD